MPILKEFDLALPIIGPLSDEMWKEKRMNFSNEVRCICALYERLFPTYKTDCSWKVLVRCVEKPIDQIKTVAGVTEVQISFNINTYNSLKPEDKKAMVLSVLQQGIERVIEVKGWKKEFFLRAYNGVIDAHYTNQWIMKKPKSSPNRQWKAYIYCEHDLTVFQATLYIENKNGELYSKTLLFREAPDEFAFAQRLGEIKWVSNHEVIFYNQRKDHFWKMNIE